MVDDAVDLVALLEQQVGEVGTGQAHQVAGRRAGR